MEDVFPPPHVVWFEPLEETTTRRIWKEYCLRYAADCESHEFDAAEVYAVDDFSRKFETWVTSKSSKRIRLLMIWHSHFLSLACQQVLRRWMEIKSYRCRIWFHAELLNSVQQAILSRCILKRVSTPIREIPKITVSGTQTEYVELWKKRIQDSLAKD
jgi:DNA polymerase III delta prime subunit